ncbi:uncharacterized protein APUU_61286S [Aspergillus puulaauensis]|uniref:Ankyrin repeat-containing domain protein n=1 Tax=Aspergillus puulaauensis TaxID=1220207 RepID=A0A7R8ASU2_9EURO|nr:uncharacterized protein APUU_61286S [Aspergillus puulaauensis]BCS28238.1 hypothetical protein APUU_61286S [Aspergillus puulaauensis]
MPQSGRDEGWLRAWCTKHDIAADEFQPQLPLISTYVLSTQKEDEDQANLLLTKASEIRRTGESKTTAAPGKVKKDRWSYEDYCGVLTEIVNASGSVGVAESVWNSLQLQKPKKARTGRFARRQQAGDEETDDLLFLLLCSTMRYKETAMFHFLANSASSDVVNRMLPTALQMRSQRNTQILLEENADPNTCSEEFITLVRGGDEEFVRLLLQSQTPIDLATLTSALPDAVQRGNVGVVQLLLAHGADANADSGIAIEKAIRAKRTDLALLMLMSPNPPLPETLAPIVSYVFFKMEILQDKKYSLIELLLNGGAAGGSVSLALGGAVLQRWTELVDLFVDKGVSINYNKAEAYRYAVHEVDLETIRILSRGKLDDDLASELFGEIDNTKYGTSITNEKWHALAGLLLDQGAAGDVVDEALIQRVEKRDLAGVTLLLRESASVDYANAAALDKAVASENEEFIDALLQYQPAAQSVNTVFDRVDRLSPDVKLSITRKLLDAGANGTAVDNILKNAMTQHTGERDREFIQILVDGGADVGQGKGYLLQLAVQSSDDITLQILLLGFPVSTILSSCIPLAMDLTETQRYKIIHILLHAGARGDEVSQALVDSIDGTSSGCQLASLLLATGEANTGFESGKAFKKAIESPNIDFIELLVQYNHLQESDFCASLLVAIDLLQRDRTRLEKIRILLMSVQELSGSTGHAALRHEMEGLKRRDDQTLGVLHMLLEAGADVNHNQGRIFVDAIELGLFECFKLFLAAHPSFQSLENAFENALSTALRANLPLDLRYLQELLATSIPQAALDKALLRTTEERNEELVLLLLRHGASVDYQDGAAVRHAVSKLDLELLAHLMRHDPAAVTLNSGFTKAMTLHDIRAKHDCYQLLLQAGSVSQRLLEEALVAAADGGWMHAAICELLLDHKASPNYATGTPLCRAIKSSNYKVDLIKLFLRYSVTEEAVAAALGAAFDTLQGETRIATVDLLLAVQKPQLTLDQLLLKAVHAPHCDHKLIQCLLKANASIFYQGGECILHAVMINDVETLRVLEPYFHGHSGVSEIFMTVWGNGKRANSHQEEAVLSVLVGAGASGEPVDMAVLESVKTVSTTPAGFAFIVNLLKAGADVNYCEGACLVEAATQANVRVIKELLAYGPRRANMSRAFPLVFRSGVDAQSLREIAVAFCSHSSAPDLTYDHPTCGPVLCLMLHTYPNERELLQYLIDKGSVVDPVVKATLPLSPSEEKVSMLCWALAQSKAALREDVVEILIKSGADVNFQAPLSQSTPLQLAIVGSRTQSVAALLQFHADPSFESNGISPLSLAASIGDTSIVRQLVNAGAAPGDGSLHEAARMVNVSVLQVLLIEAKQRDYPCSRFQGRTALAELCMTAGNKPISQLKAAMSLLKNNGDFRRKSKGKSVLHFALDHPNAILVSQALLDVFMSEYVNDDFNVFEDGPYRYSPLAYVSRGLNKAPPTQRTGLIDLLLEFECRDRFWAAEGEQPVDMVGAPEEIMRTLKTQKQRQVRIQEEHEDHERRLMHRRAEQAEELSSLRARHNLTLDHTREVASETARLEHETASRQATIASQRYDAELAYMQRVTDLANRRKDDSNYREVEHRRQLALMENSQRDESYGIEKQRREEEAAFVQHRERLLTSGYEDRARIDRDRYAEQMRLFDAQKGIMEMNARPKVVKQIAYEADSLD